MENKEIIIDGVDISKCKHYDEVFNYCDQSYLGEGGLLKNTKNPKRCECSPNCYYKQLKRKEQEYEELRQYHNKCCEENEKKLEEWLEKYNQVSKDFYNGKYCNKENCSLLESKDQECEKLKKQLERKEENYQKLLNKSNKYIHNLVDENVQDISNLGRQLDQLKAENETYKKMFEDKDVRLALNEIRTGERHLWLNKAKRLEQTLIEIKEIAENGCYDDCGMPLDELSIILQKISEVEDVNI